MPPNPASAKLMNVDTDYPLDKIVYRHEGSFSIGSYYSVVTVPAIAHGLTFTPLVSMRWSTTPDFAVSYELGGSPIPDDFSRADYGIFVSLEADATNVYLEMVNFMNSGYTIYYEIFGFEPTNHNDEAPFTVAGDTNMIFNGENNYTKLYLADRVPVSVVPNTPTVINHNLGDIIQVLGWEELSSGRIVPIVYNSISDASTFGINFGFVVTDNQLLIYPYFNTATHAHYRIYIDE